MQTMQPFILPSYVLIVNKSVTYKPYKASAANDARISILTSGSQALPA